MYLYRTKHKILRAMSTMAFKKRGNPVDEIVSSKEVIKQVSMFYNKERRVAMAISSLKADGLSEYKGWGDDGYVKVCLTQEGLDALSNWKFLKMQNNLMAVIARDSIMVIATVAIAWVTIYSVIKSNEINSVKEQVKELKTGQHKQEIESAHQANQLRILQDSLLNK
jgi:hypothetical protein